MLTVEEKAFLAEMAQKHLPGQHDQRDHGRRLGGIRRALTGATDVGELAAAAEREAWRITGRDIYFDFDDTDLQVSREHAEGVLRGLERFPMVPLGVVASGRGSVPFDARSMAHHHTQYAARNGRVVEESVIAFNPYYAGSPVRYWASLEESVAVGWLTDGSPMGTALHEFGHAMSSFASPARSMRQHLKAPGRGDKGIAKMVGQGVSRYASTDQEELVAEVFADVMANGEGASPLSKELFKVIEDAYRARVEAGRAGRLQQ